MTPSQHQEFVTTGRGLDRNNPAMKLFEKAKKFGIWNPSEIDLTQDKQDWQTLQPDEKDLILRLTSVFQAGEEAVTLDLLPLIMAIAKEGRLEEEIFLTTFLWEEAKHTDFFQRYLHEVLGAQGEDLSHYHTPSYQTIFYEALPQSLNRLMTDPSPRAQVVASVTYNMIVEGVLAETGYHSYFTTLQRNDIMPGMVEGIQKLKQDESRHIAYGIFLISRLIAENDDLWEIADTTMNQLLLPAVNIITEAFAHYDPVPFDLKQDEFVGYAMMQFQKRYARIEQARGAKLGDIYKVTDTIIEQNDA